MQLYLPADLCPHPEPDKDTDPTWSDWVDEHPESTGPGIEHVCLEYPLGPNGNLSCPPYSGYYVSIVRDSKRGRLLGPYERHIDAYANVERARRKAEEIDSWAGFDAFGTCLMSSPNPLPPGKLNNLIGLEPWSLEDIR